MRIRPCGVGFIVPDGGRGAPSETVFPAAGVFRRKDLAGIGIFVYLCPPQRECNNLLHRVQGEKAEDSEAAAENPDAGLPDNGPVW